MRQASRQNRYSNLVLLRRIQYERACAQRGNRNTDSRPLRVAQRNGRGYQKSGTSGVTYKHWLQPHNSQDFAGNDNTGALRGSHMAEDVAFLRGINVGGHGAVTMEDLKKAFEACAFKDVKTIATSGDVAFSATMAEAAVVKKAEAALKKRLGRKTPVHVRSRDELRKMVQAQCSRGL